MENGSEYYRIHFLNFKFSKHFIIECILSLHVIFFKSSFSTYLLETKNFTSASLFQFVFECYGILTYQAIFLSRALPLILPGQVKNRNHNIITFFLLSAPNADDPKLFLNTPPVSLPGRACQRRRRRANHRTVADRRAVLRRRLSNGHPAPLGGRRRLGRQRHQAQGPPEAELENERRRLGSEQRQPDGAGLQPAGQRRRHAQQHDAHVQRPRASSSRTETVQKVCQNTLILI